MKRTKMDAEASIGKLVKAHTSFIALESKLPISSTVDNLREKFDQAANRVLSLYEKEMKEITSEVARFLGELDDRQHDEETINEVIELFPNALKQVHSDDLLYPVSCLLLSTHGYSFVPLLAKEGMRRKIFPEEEIGGIYDPSDPTGSEEIMQDFLCMNGAMLLRENLGISPEEYQHQESKKSDRQFQKLKAEAHEENDIKRTMVLRQLVHLGIIQKKNIIDFDMIRHSSSNSTSKKRFEFLLSLCPEGLALRERNSDRGYLPIENHAWSVCKEGFGILLKAGIQHYPKKMGFLFEKNPLSGKRTIEFAMSREGLELTHEDLFQFMHEARPTSVLYYMMSYGLRRNTFLSSGNTTPMPSTYAMKEEDCL